MWRHFADTRLWPAERLFFEIYGQALQGRPGTAGFLDGIVGDWLEHAHAVLDAARQSPGDTPGPTPASASR